MDYKEGFAYAKHYSGRLSNLTDNSTDDDIRDVYSDWAVVYDKDLRAACCVFHKPMVDCLDVAIKETFQDKPKSDIRIMDAGAGTGLVGVELHKQGYSNVDALDISQAMLDEAKKKNVYKKFICAALSDQRTPGVETGQYDALICVGTLVFAHVRPTAFVEMIRMVKNGGLICFSMRSADREAYEEKMVELENQGRWRLFRERKVPHYEKEDMPRECSAFVYKVSENKTSFTSEN